METPIETGTRTPYAVRVRTAQCNFTSGTTPTAADDETLGYSQNSRWYKSDYPRRWFVCADASEGVAVWVEVPLMEMGWYVVAVTSETIDAGKMVNLYNDSGTLKARKANATDATKPCDGFAGQSWTSGVTAVIQTLYGMTIPNLSSLTVGQQLYLSTTGGGVTGTAPSTSGNIVQPIGKAISTTTAIFAPGPILTLA